ncbi:MAG: hypothetical protein ACOH2A_05060 [Sphingobacteriaceae bacterium]
MFEIKYILVPLVLLLVAFLYLTYTKTRKGNQKQRLLLRLDDVMESYKLTPDVTDHFEGQVLALDPVLNKFIWLNDKTSNVIDLRKIIACNLILKVLTVQLELVYDDSLPQSSFTIVFYRKFIDSKMSRMALTRKAKRWSNRISASIPAENTLYEIAEPENKVKSGREPVINYSMLRTS